MHNEKPVLGYFNSYIDPKEIVVKAKGSEDETNELNFTIRDELYIAPEPWVEKNVEIHFDGGQIKLKRELFLKLSEDYEKRYQADIHHSAIAELERATKALPEEKAKQFIAILHSLQKQLDDQREQKRK